MTNPTEQINKEAEAFVGTLSIENSALSKANEVYDEESEEKIMYIPTPNFTDCGTAGSYLPISVANETISILARYRSEFDFVDFVKEKLKYNSRVAVCMAFFSEQIDALVLAIKQFESNKALILGDMAGIGKGRVCAGILRYAYVNNFIPVFITEKENLFSDIFRDILGIGGFGGAGGNLIQPSPLIMNPLSRKIIEGEDGVRRRVTINPITDNNDNVLYTPSTKKEIDAFIERFDSNSEFKGKLNLKKKNNEFNFNSVFLTYNVISKTRGESGDAKRDFISKIAPKSIIIFDECHNASGKSKLGEYAKMYVNDAKGVLFSSATFAKNPQAFPLYIIKTAMREAQIDVTNIEDAISVGGENVSEYISSVLVKEGQMIRRDRAFAGCTVDTIYEGSDKTGNEAVEAKDSIYNTFDRATEKFRDIYNYIKLRDFVSVIDVAIDKKADELQFELASQDDYLSAKGTGLVKEELQAEFIKDNKDKWVVVSKETNTLGATTKFHYTENILLAIKSKFTADAIIKELQSEVEYPNIDGTIHKTNRKPVVAIRATGENLFSKLNLKAGDKIQNDFSVYIRAVVSGVMSGRVVFRKVNKDLFVPKYVLKLDDKEHTEEVALYEIDSTDLPDNGRKLNQLLEDANNYTSNIPLCPIDYLIYRIQEVQRKSNDRYGSVTPNYKVAEVTGRNYALYKDVDSDLWTYKPNNRDRSVKGIFNSFNKGRTDVLIINSSGSTGGSIHSSVEFSDRRPRIMFIPQIELNVATEVQKRGRINRSGQVNMPTYLYVLSQIPSEIRKFLSLKKKLRKLDANVAANQTQNSNIVNIKDKQGKEILDVFNKYGEEAFVKLLDNPDNYTYKNIYDLMMRNPMTTVFAEAESSSGEVIQAVLQPFSRELEIYPCDLQEEFYNQINIICDSVIETHKNDGTYQLELEIEDLKASLQSRVVRQMNSGETEFSKPLFMEDKYCLDRKKIWSKDKVEAEAIKMAKSFYKDRTDSSEYVDLDKFHRDLLEDFELEYDIYSNIKKNEFVSVKEPKRDEFMSDEEFNSEYALYQEAYLRRQQSLDNDKTEINGLLSYFSPKRNVTIPDFIPKDAESSTIYKFGKFIGYSFKKTSEQNKYSKGSIHLKFAVLPKLADVSSTAPSVELSMGSRESLATIKDIRINSTNTFSSTFKIGLETMGEKDSKYVDDWKINPNQRRVSRFLSGNILSGIQLANNMDDIKGWSLVKYTNEDGTVSTGIRLDYPIGEFIPMSNSKSTEIDVPIQVALNNPNIIDYIKLTPNSAEGNPYRFKIGVNTYRSKNVPSIGAGKELIVKNLIGISRGKKEDVNSVYIEMFQASTRKKNKANDKFEVLTYPTLNTSEVNNPLFFSPFLSNYTVHLDRIYVKEKNDRGSGYKVENTTFKDGGLEGFKRLAGFSKIYKFTDIDTEDGANKLTSFFKELYDEQDLSMDFPQNINDYYNILFQKDLYVSKQGENKEKEKIETFEYGRYEYKLDIDYNEKYKSSIGNPPSFVEYISGKNAFDKGTIILGKPLLPSFARAYNIYPINLSNDDTIKLLLSIFAPDDKEKFIKELTERAEKGEDNNKIGDYVTIVSIKNTVPQLKYIFGNRRTSEIGELLKTYALKGDITKLLYETIEEGEDVIKPTKRKTKITPEDAEKFINYLVF
jgi:hypothetical protein